MRKQKIAYPHSQKFRRDKKSKKRKFKKSEVATRVVKDHSERRNELLDEAQKLFYKDGYENTSVNEIIEAVGIAKGTFYHYFKSKEDLLDQLIERITSTILIQLELIVKDREMNAIDKLNKFYIDAGNYKIENKEAIIVAARVFHNDDNLRMKDKLLKRILHISTPLLTHIIKQGVKERSFKTPYSDHLAPLIFHMGFYLRDEFAAVIVRSKIEKSEIKRIIDTCMMYQDAIERLLGAPKKSIRIFTRKLILSFFD